MSIFWYSILKFIIEKISNNNSKNKFLKIGNYRDSHLIINIHIKIFGLISRSTMIYKLIKTTRSAGSLLSPIRACYMLEP
jgi:hypothetical protein